jgi:hypothetical protein
MPHISLWSAQSRAISNGAAKWISHFIVTSSISSATCAGRNGSTKSRDWSKAPNSSANASLATKTASRRCRSST